MSSITLAGGCFWCVEAVFKRLNGVLSVTSGYANGPKPKPTSESVSTGATGYAEAVKIEFDPQVISLETLLEVFWISHDPTTLNRQGNDHGTQYRSGIYYHAPEQLPIIKESIRQLEAAQTYADPIVTEVCPETNFYPAEDYHRDFYDQNRAYGYCRLVIDPKIEKLTKNFQEKLKKDLSD